MQRKSVRDDFYEQERYANQELRRFRANYPENAALIQNYVEDACDRRFMMAVLSNMKIRTGIC